MQELASGYLPQAQRLLAGPDGNTVRDELATLASRAVSTGGVERDDTLDAIAKRIDLRKKSILGDIPDDVEERRAFALALAHTYIASLQ